MYVTQKAIKGRVLAYHLAENLVDDEYEPLQTYFPDEEILFVEEDIGEIYPEWRLFFDGVVNFKGLGIGAVLVSKTSQCYSVIAELHFPSTNKMTEYESCILGLKLALDIGVRELLVIGDSDLLIHQVWGEWVVKNSKITPYVELVQELCGRFKEVDFRHIPRTQNKFVDALDTTSSMIQHP